MAGGKAKDRKARIATTVGTQANRQHTSKAIVLSLFEVGSQASRVQNTIGGAVDGVQEPEEEGRVGVFAAVTTSRGRAGTFCLSTMERMITFAIPSSHRSVLRKRALD